MSCPGFQGVFSEALISLRLRCVPTLKLWHKRKLLRKRLFLLACHELVEGIKQEKEVLIGVKHRMSK